jgi:hypothetical protein
MKSSQGSQAWSRVTSEQQAVVVGLVGDHVAAEVQDGQVQQLFLDEVEDVEHAAGAAVAVGERVDGFELVVAHGHADQGVQLGLVVKEALPVGQHVAQAGFAFGRGVDHLTGAVVGELGARGAADVHVHALEGAADVHGGGGAQRPRLERLKALVQRGAVAQGFFGGRVGVVVALRVLEQLVGRGDDVFDFRAVFGFQQRDGVDQHRLVGDELGRLLELGQRGAGLDAGLEHGPGLQLVRRGQRRQLVVGLLGVPGGAASVMMQKTCFIDRSTAYVAADDTSTKHVLILLKWRHVAPCGVAGE